MIFDIISDIISDIMSDIMFDMMVLKSQNLFHISLEDIKYLISQLGRYHKFDITDRKISHSFEVQCNRPVHIFTFFQFQSKL